jgi:hypothetical protein
VKQQPPGNEASLIGANSVPRYRYRSRLPQMAFL